MKTLALLITGICAGLYLTMPVLSVLEALAHGRSPWKRQDRRAQA